MKLMRRRFSFASVVFALVAPSLVEPAFAQEQAKPVAKTEAAPVRKPLVSPIAPTHANVSYGKHAKQVIDFYQAKSDKPTPLVVFIHGGGWRQGSKTAVDPTPYVKAGISLAAIEYRFIDEAMVDGVEPPVHAALHDAARGIQFVRSKSQEWNLDKTRVAAIGSSAGACTSLWINFHDDLAEPKSDDPVARESTRLTCVAVIGAQTSLDPKQMHEWMPNSTYGAHAFGLVDPKTKKSQSFADFLAARERLLPWIKEYSPYELVTKDDPPASLYYNRPPALGQDQNDPTHSANFGFGLQEKCKSVGVPCELTPGGTRDEQWKKVAAYLIAKLKSAN